MLSKPGGGFPHIPGPQPSGGTTLQNLKKAVPKPWLCGGVRHSDFCSNQARDSACEYAWVRLFKSKPVIFKSSNFKPSLIPKPLNPKPLKSINPMVSKLLPQPAPCNDRAELKAQVSSKQITQAESTFGTHRGDWALYFWATEVVYKSKALKPLQC